MNSKLYQKYLSLKIENPVIIYLFKSQNHYFFIAEDAIKLAPLLDLDLINLNSVLKKCEFNVDNYEKYIKQIHNLKLNVKIIYLSNDIFNYNLDKCFNSCKYNELISNFLDVDINELSISQAFDLLHLLQSKFRNIKI